MSTAIQRAGDPAPLAVSPRAGRAIIMAEALTQEADQRKLLGEYVRAHMIEGTDFGTVPGTKNKTLLKPGAEKLTQLYRCIPRFVIEEKIENWDTGLFYYRFSCQVVTQADDAIVAEGVGSCSTYESRYRWRISGRKCPACGAEAIQRSKFPPKDDPDAAPGWYCFAKKGGCGAQFEADDYGIVDQQIGRVQNPDLLDQVNTVLKMAKKRALVDAAIALARCSDIFTQDLDDMVGDSAAEQPPAEKPKKAEPARPIVPDELRQKVRSAPTLAELGNVWTALTPEQQKILLEDKNKRKAELSAPPPAAPVQAPAPTEGEHRSDPTPTPATNSGTPSARTPSAPSAATPRPSASAATSAEPGAKPMPAAERRTGPDNSPSALLALMHHIDVAWSEIRDRIEGKGLDIANKCGVYATPETRFGEIPLSVREKLGDELRERAGKLDALREKKAANRAAREASVA